MDNGAANALKSLKKAFDVAQAELGKKGKLPKPKEDVQAILNKCVTLASAVEKQRADLLKSIKDYQTALTDVEGACDAYNKQINKDEFGLSKGNNEEERSINAVRHNLTKKLDEVGLGSKSPRKEAQKLREALESVDLGSF